MFYGAFFSWSAQAHRPLEIQENDERLSKEFETCLIFVHALLLWGMKPLILIRLSVGSMPLWDKE